MKTIARNRTKFINEIFANTKVCLFTDSRNGQYGVPCEPQCAREELEQFSFARLYDRGNGKYKVQILSNEWYELDTNEQPVTEPAPVVEEVAAKAKPVAYVGPQAAQSVTPEQVVEVTRDRFVQADFATLNKNGTLGEYEREVERGGYRSEPCKVTHVVTLTPAQWASFTSNLLSDLTWLAGKGGSDSVADLPEVAHFWDYTPEQQAEWHKYGYLLVVEVRCEGQETIYVDPQGFSYARYVGLYGVPMIPIRKAA